MTDRFDCLDQAHIEDMARVAGRQLSSSGMGYAEVILTPGDATRYPIIVMGAGRLASEGQGNVVVQREYLVILASTFGLAYPWTGHSVHPDYADIKWCQRHAQNGWTGEVMARFLSALAVHVGPVPA